MQPGNNLRSLRTSCAWNLLSANVRLLLPLQLGHCASSSSKRYRACSLNEAVSTSFHYSPCFCCDPTKHLDRYRISSTCVAKCRSSCCNLLLLDCAGDTEHETTSYEDVQLPLLGRPWLRVAS